MNLEVLKMNDKKEAMTKEEQKQSYEPRTGIIVDGVVFPFSMTCKEYDEYLKYLEEKKQSK